jgi:hypothetical protein
MATSVVYAGRARTQYYVIATHVSALFVRPPHDPRLGLSARSRDRGVLSHRARDRATEGNVSEPEYTPGAGQTTPNDQVMILWGVPAEAQQFHVYRAGESLSLCGRWSAAGLTDHNAPAVPAGRRCGLCMDEMIRLMGDEIVRLRDRCATLEVENKALRERISV